MVRVKKLPEVFGGEKLITLQRVGIWPHCVLPAFGLVKSLQTAIVHQEFGVFVEFFLDRWI